jgi:CO dehydrogenase/acetyl-CoA synthase epsilon subunit
MRSELIFRAKETVANRYRLCQTVSKATRRLHIASRNTTETINSAFAHIAEEFDVPVAATPVTVLS